MVELAHERGGFVLVLRGHRASHEGEGERFGGAGRVSATRRSRGGAEEAIKHSGCLSTNLGVCTRKRARGDNYRSIEDSQTEMVQNSLNT